MVIIMDCTIELMAKDGATMEEIQELFAQATRQGKAGTTLYLVFDK